MPQQTRIPRRVPWRRYWYRTGSAGVLASVLYPQSVTETVGPAADVVTTGPSTYARGIVESVGAATDVVTRPTAIARGIAETVGPAADTISRTYGAVRPVSETVGAGSDTVTRQFVGARTVAETVGAAADAISRVGTLARALTETVSTAADTVTRVAVYIRGRSETVGPATDTVTDQKQKLINVVETVGPAADVVTRIWAGARSISETVGASADTPTRQTAAARGVSETIGPATDAISKAYGVARGVGETIGPASISANRLYGALRGVSESTGPASDGITKQLSLARLLAETTVVVGTVSRQIGYGRTFAETVGPASDVVSGIYARPFWVLDRLQVSGPQPRLRLESVSPIILVRGTPGDLSPAYRELILADGPVGYWRLNELSGPAQDSTGSGHPGTVTGAVTRGVAGAISDGDTAMAFSDAGQGQVNLGNPAAFQINVGSLEAWVQATTVDGSYRGILVKQSAYGMFLKNGRLLAYAWAGDVGDHDSGVLITDGNWHLVVLTFQLGVAASTKLYVDGSATGPAFMTSLENQGAPLLVASGFVGGQWMTGGADEPAIYPYVLRPDQIAAHWLTGRTGRQARNKLPVVGTAVTSRVTGLRNDLRVNSD